MRSGEISGSRKETGTRQAFGWPFLSTTKTSPSLATRSRTSPGELRSSIIFRVLKSTFKAGPSVVDFGAGPRAPIVAPDFVFVQPLRRARDDEGQVMRAGVPHRRVQVANVPALIPVRRVGNGRCIDEDPRHLVRVVGRKFDGKDVVPAVRCLQRRAGIDFAVGRRAKLDEREGPLSFGEFALYPIDVHRRPQYSPPRFSFRVSGFLLPRSADVARPISLISPFGRIWIGVSSSLLRSFSSSSIVDCWLITSLRRWTHWTIIIVQPTTIGCIVNGAARFGVCIR